ncbi:MAG: ATP-binding protein [Dehalococcoidia bacterium]
MSASTLLRYLTDIPFILIFFLVSAAAIRHPRRANFDTALLFGVIALIIVAALLRTALHLKPVAIYTATVSSLLMVLPYLLLRLVDDFSRVPRRLMHFALAGLLLSVANFFVFGPPKALLLILAYVLYFFGLQVYAADACIREARHTGGVTRRRMQAVAAGSGFLGLTILVAGFQATLPGLAGLWSGISQVCGLSSGLGYFLGFAPPAWLRRAWQEPELRAFLGRAASLPRLPDTESIVRALEDGAATSLGAPSAAIGLWDESAHRLHFERFGKLEVQPGHRIAGQAFVDQRPIFSANAVRDDPSNAEAYRRHGASAVLSAPITAGAQRLGVLTLHAPRAPIFADDDLGLVQLLADQAAVILESRALIDEASRVRAREEATRMKDDFLSSAAHDLKTPLTTLIAQAQLLERRATLRPDAPPDMAGIQRIVRESKRLNSLILELLDASRLDRGKLKLNPERTDLVTLARETCQLQPTERHRCMLEASVPVFGNFDVVRIKQLVGNLLENAMKYSPDGGEIVLRVWRETAEAYFSVTDRGIGIPAIDLPYVFDRFHRGTNVDDHRFAGMGLGLFICRGIVEQHGGRIWATSQPGRGSVFHVTLPAIGGDSRHG